MIVSQFVLKDSKLGHINFIKMIQRIQSLYLSLTTIVSLLFLKGSFLKFINISGDVIKVHFSEVIKESSVQGSEIVESLLPLFLLIILIPLFSGITIFLYKNRKMQLLFTSLLIALEVLLIIAMVYYSWHITTVYDATLAPGFKMVMPVLILIFSILAYRGIKKDDDLVKSYDRLR